MSINICKVIILLITVVFATLSSAQPVAPPFPFEDSYGGQVDNVMKSAKVKIKKTYYKLNGESEPATLYHVHEYNRKGQLINQKWYNLISKQQMYSAAYFYGKDDFLESSIEKMTYEYDDINYCARQLENNGYLMSNAAGDALGELIPTDADSLIYVKTIYRRDTFGGYNTKKYFFNDSLYKQKMCNFGQLRQNLFHTLNQNLYINKDKSVSYFYSDTLYKADSTYRSSDTLIINLKSKTSNSDCIKIFMVKKNNKYIISSIDLSIFSMRLYFSYRNCSIYANNSVTLRSEITSVSYVYSNEFNFVPYLIHKFQDLDTLGSDLNDRIFLNAIANISYFSQARGCIYYSTIKNGNLANEEQYAIGSDMLKKIRDVKYTNHNLVSEKMNYNACFRLQALSKALNYDQIESIEEINTYEYFDK